MELFVSVTHQIISHALRAEPRKLANTRERDFKGKKVTACSKNTHPCNNYNIVVLCIEYTSATCLYIVYENKSCNSVVLCI